MTDLPSLDTTPKATKQDNTRTEPTKYGTFNDIMYSNIGSKKISVIKRPTNNTGQVGLDSGS